MRLPAIGSLRFNAIAFAAAALSLVPYVLQFHTQETVQFGDMIDLQVYRWGGMATWHSSTELYHGLFVNALPFLYPPIAALVFSVVSHVSFNTNEIAITAVSLACLAWCIWAAWGRLGRRALAERAGLTAALFAVALWLEPVQQTLGFGQINLVLLAVAFGDLALPDRSRIKGIGVGLATGFKLTPAVFIAYLLITRRFRAATVATGAFGATMAIGLYTLPTESREYWGGVFAQQRIAQYVMTNQSINGGILRLGASVNTARLLWEAASAVVALIGLYLAYRLHRAGDEYLAVMACAFVALLISPISWTHHYVWFVPFLALLVHRCMLGGGRTRLWIPVAFTAAFLAWPMRLNYTTGRWDPHAPALATGLIWFLPHTQGADLHWNDYQALAGNYYTLTALAIAIAVPLWQVRKKRHGAQIGAAGLRIPLERSEYDAAVGNADGTIDAGSETGSETGSGRVTAGVAHGAAGPPADSAG
jgi:alpha-1,2-mannosyltransferase